MPRPKLPDDKRKSFMLRIRLSPTEKERLMKMSGGAMSQYVRWRIFGKRNVNYL